MLPLRLWLKDFMNHSFTEIECSEFRSVLIVGRNRKNPLQSMGVGKSNLFKAIRYVLFGEVEVSQLDKIVRHGTSRCEVGFEFQIGSRIFRVVRSRNKKTKKTDLQIFEKFDDWKNISQKTSTETDLELAKIIKISCSAFDHSCLFAQSDLKGLASVSPGERKSILKEPLQISIYNKYQKVAKDKVSKISKELEKVQVLINSLGNPAEQLQLFSSQLNSEEAQLIPLDREKNTLNFQLENIKTLITDLEKKETTDINEISNQINQIQENNKEIIQKAKIILQDHNNNKQNLENHKLTSKTTQKEIEELNNIQFTFETNPNDLKQDIEKLTAQEIEYKAQIQKFNQDIRNFSKPLPPEGQCQECLQAISHDYRDICEQKRQQTLKLTNQQLQDIQNFLSNLQINKKDKETQLKNIINLQEKQKETQHQIKQKELTLAFTQGQITTLEKTVSSQFSELEELKKLNSKYKEEEQNLKNKLQEFNIQQIKQDIQEKQSQLIRIQKQIQTNQDQIREKHVNIGSLKEKIRIKTEEQITLQQYQIQLQDTHKLLARWERVSQAFSSSGIPTYIINTVLDELQVLCNNLLAELRPGIEMVFSVSKIRDNGEQEDTLLISYRVNGEEFEYEELSGGQKLLVALSLKLGLSLIIQHRIGIDLKFLLLDEVDQNLDVAAVSDFFEVIKKWSERFVIFIITHNPKLQEKFNSFILIESNENGSEGKLVSTY